MAKKNGIYNKKLTFSQPEGSRRRKGSSQSKEG